MKNSRPESVVRLFIYGSVMSNMGNHRVIEGARFIGPARTKAHFNMVDLGYFPAISGGGNTSIIGEVYSVDLATLRLIDRLEGHPHFYTRIMIELEDGEFLFSYVLGLSQSRPYPRVQNGDWRDHFEQKSLDQQSKRRSL